MKSLEPGGNFFFFFCCLDCPWDGLIRVLSGGGLTSPEIR